MAADAYLKVAAGQLRQAVNVLKQEASAIRSDAANTRRKMETDVMNIKNEKHVKDIESMNPQLPSPTTEILKIDSKRMDSKASDLKKEIDNQMAQAEQAARAKESMASDLENRASSLESLAADSRLR